MSNLNELKPIKKLNPFGKFCCTIGNLPSSYVLSLTYEEQLLWFCNFLEKTVIPTINNNAEAVEEIQNLFIELKEYVNNYFENLDIQEEINNKLDEMAEAGQLVEIISAYLQLQCVYGYNNISDMKNATNLINGSFARTYGEDSLNDGLGAFYKVRQILNTDVIDDINIVALSNPNLVAEKITSTSDSNDTILIGDSYSEGYTVLNGQATYVNGWSSYLKNLLNLSDEHCYIFDEGGIGFADSGQQGHSGFLHLLQDNISNIKNKKKIKNIIVCGGHNDTYQTFSAIDTAIANFMAYCKTEFPNAKVYIGMVANDGRTNETGITKRQAIKNTVLIAYQNSCAYGAIYLNGVENILKYYPNLGEDLYHPTENGYRILATKIFQAFSNGYASYVLPLENITFNDTSNINFGDVRIGAQIVNNLTQFRILSGTMTFNTPIPSTFGYIDLGAVNCKNYKFTEYGTLEIPVFIGITTNDNQYYGGYGYMSINNQNHIILAFRHYKNDGTNISNFTNIKKIFLDTGYATVSTYNC